MVSKHTVGILFLILILFSNQVSASPLNQPSLGTESTVAANRAAATTTTQDQPDRKTDVEPSSDVDRVDLKYLKDYFVDTGKIVASPLHWQAKDWIKVGLVLGVTSSLFLVDDKVMNFAQSHQSPVASKVASVGNALGNGAYTLPAVGAFYMYGSLTDDHKARRASLLALESYAISGVFTSGLKMLAERHRPNSGDSTTNWDGPHLSLKNVSFSSGHTASAFSIATIFAHEYEDNPYVPPIAYGLATLTGLSRIYSNEHWSSDVFVGAALGYFVSKALLHYHRADKDKMRNLMILPVVSKDMTGISMKLDF
jgi:membrane-associated phospholipid phosphatase